MVRIDGNHEIGDPGPARKDVGSLIQIEQGGCPFRTREGLAEGESGNLPQESVRPTKSSKLLPVNSFHHQTEGTIGDNGEGPAWSAVPAEEKCPGRWGVI